MRQHSDSRELAESAYDAVTAAEKELGYVH